MSLEINETDFFEMYMTNYGVLTYFYEKGQPLKCFKQKGELIRFVFEDNSGCKIILENLLTRVKTSEMKDPKGDN